VSVPAALLYLATRTHWLAHHQAAEEAFDELEHVVGLIETTIDIPVAGTYAGPCNVCRADMYAKPDAQTVECRPCNLTYDMAARREWLLSSAEDRLERSTDVARALVAYGRSITRKRIDVWASRGQLPAKGKDASGRPLYRVGDVIALLNHAEERERKDA
jgi:hypothetical protein